MKIAILFDNFGPYHLARLNAASEVCTVLGIEIHPRSREYGWDPDMGPRAFESVTLLEPAPGTTSMLNQINQLEEALKRFAPQCVFVPGWSARYALAALWWCRSHKVPAVLMSESTRCDAPRVRAKEKVKSWIVSMCSAALVGGAAHAEYLVSLGMPAERIFQGYDAVDNQYFHHMAESARAKAIDLSKQLQLPRPYFLSVARFIAKKNLAWLIESYARYRQAFQGMRVNGQGINGSPWSLVLLGEGRDRPLLKRRISELEILPYVSLPGFKCYQDLPAYYGLASVLVHPSRIEPWGLVVNEAMASGLPVLVSNACGCAGDLVRDGKNGFLFDPSNSEQLVELMLRVSTQPEELPALGKAGFEHISHWGLERFTSAVLAAAEKAVLIGAGKESFWKGLLVRWLSGAR
jgi:glycosyltransferase involved in cell wall biosynthesis